jgi:hypothetical protein
MSFDGIEFANLVGMRISFLFEYDNASRGTHARMMCKQYVAFCLFANLKLSYKF